MTTSHSQALEKPHLRYNSQCCLVLYLELRPFDKLYTPVSSLYCNNLIFYAMISLSTAILMPPQPVTRTHAAQRAQHNPYRFPCPDPNCKRWFSSKGGRTYHLHATGHSKPSRPHQRSLDGDPARHSPHSSKHGDSDCMDQDEEQEGHTGGENEGGDREPGPDTKRDPRPCRTYHPSLDGKPYHYPH
jgi:hypothetical protein